MAWVLWAALLPVVLGANWTLVHPQNDPTSPVARYYHAIASNDTSHGPKYLFGGLEYTGTAYVPLNDVWVNKLPQWEQLTHSIHGGPPPARGYHTFTYVGGSTFLLYGGKSEPPNENYYNDTWAFDSAAMTWKLLTPPAGGPPGRFYHTAVAANGSLYVFGGATRDVIVVLNDVWEFNVTTLEWSERWRNGTVNSPPARQGHTAVPYGAGFVIYGGRPGLAKGAYGDAWWFDINNPGWSLIHKGTGEAPPPRAAHSAGLMRGQMFIFAGTFIQLDPPYPETYHNDLWALDVATRKWTEIEKDDPTEVPTRPWKRKGHTAQVVMENKMTIFGGYGDFQGLRNDLWMYH